MSGGRCIPYLQPEAVTAFCRTLAGEVEQLFRRHICEADAITQQEAGQAMCGLLVAIDTASRALLRASHGGLLRQVQDINDGITRYRMELSAELGVDLPLPQQEEEEPEAPQAVPPAEEHTQDVILEVGSNDGLPATLSEALVSFRTCRCVSPKAPSFFLYSRIRPNDMVTWCIQCKGVASASGRPGEEVNDDVPF